MTAVFEGRAGVRSVFCACCCLLVVLSSAACGDDDDTTPDDGGVDATTGSGGTGGIRVRDGGGGGDPITGDDPIPECDRFDPLACRPGQDCTVVIRRAPTETSFLIYTGCIDRDVARGMNAPCDPWGGFAKPYEAPGLGDEVYVDPCEPGLFCAADPNHRNASSCQQACESGRFQGQRGAFCGGNDKYCTGPGFYEEVCRTADGCDPADPDSCGDASGCYLRFNDTSEGVLAVCLPTVEEPLADGTACQFLNDCMPGSSCWGPARFPPGRWTEADLRCRRSCALAGVAGDAGTDDDGGVSADPMSSCGSGQVCRDFSEAGLDTSTLPGIGQCE